MTKEKGIVCTIFLVINVRNNGTGIDNGAGETNLEGTVINVENGIGVNVTTGSLEMFSGEINVYDGYGIWNNESVALYGGTINVNSTEGDERGVYNNGISASVSLEGGTINVTGSDVASNISYGIYDAGGTVTVLNGEITADSTVGTADENGDIVGGNAYALYSTGWNAGNVTIENDGANTTATIRATAMDNVMNNSTDFALTTSNAIGDGYYYLVCES